MKLYELTSNYLQFFNQLENDDVDPETIRDTLDCIEGAIEEKAQSTARMIKTMESTSDAIEAEIKRLQQRKKVNDNKVSWLKKYIQHQLELVGMDKIKTPTFTISLQNNPPAVQIDDEKHIPASYLTVVPEQYVPDKERIAEALKNGEAVPGCQLVQGRRLSIR